MLITIDAENIKGNVTVEILKYAKGGACIRLIDAEDGCPAATATVCIPEAQPPPWHVWLKGWSENKGLPEALAAAGVVKLLPQTRRCGCAHAQLSLVVGLAAERAQACDHVFRGSDKLCHKCGLYFPESNKEQDEEGEKRRGSV